MAAITSSLPIDPSRSSRFPISISEQLLREENPRKRQRVNVQLNHRPKAIGDNVKSIITALSQRGERGCKLSVTDESNGNEHLYHGNQQPTRSAALIYDAASKSFTLDRIDTDFRFNLCGTPTNDDTTSLASKYPQLDTGLQENEEGEGDLFDENLEDHDPDTEPPDPNNPYDYRHFLKADRMDRSPSPEPSQLGSPIPRHTLGASPFISASSNRSPHPAKPPRRRPLPNSRDRSPNLRGEADADNEDSEADDILTIDMGDSTSVNNKPWRSVLGALNEGGRSSGPISLRSAASSMSPSLRGDSDVEEESKSNADVEEIDLGDEGVDVESQGAEDEEAQTTGAVSDEDEDPFAAQLEHQLIAEAMSEAEQEEQGGVSINDGDSQGDGVNGVEHRVVEESSEESEEE